VKPQSSNRSPTSFSHWASYSDGWPWASKSNFICQSKETDSTVSLAK
jgi:hypothetical protein